MCRGSGFTRVKIGGCLDWLFFGDAVVIVKFLFFFSCNVVEIV